VKNTIVVYSKCAWMVIGSYSVTTDIYMHFMYCFSVMKISLTLQA